MTIGMMRAGPLAPAPYIQTVHLPHLTVIIDYRNGQMFALTDERLTIWLAYLEGASVPESSTAETLISDLVSQGQLIVSRSRLRVPPPVHIAQPEPSWGTREVSAQLKAPGSAPWRWRLAAVPAILVMLAVRELGRRDRRFARMCALATVAQRRPWASNASACHAVRAVRWAARLVPARVACLEESMTAALLVAATGRRARWVHGMATDPIRLHAWIADDGGQPMEEPSETDLYTPINRHHTGDVRE